VRTRLPALAMAPIGAGHEGGLAPSGKPRPGGRGFFLSIILFQELSHVIHRTASDLISVRIVRGINLKVDFGIENLRDTCMTVRS